MASPSMWTSRPSSKRQMQNYELPRWQPSMAESIIPPPIVNVPSRNNTPSRSVMVTRSVVLEKPQAAESRESELQADLQYLLDAQAEGLVRGVEDDRSSNGSLTPTTRNARPGVPHQINRPVKRKIGLRSARKGIYSCILALSAVKDEELSIADQTLQSKEHELEQIESWERKRRGLTEAASKFDDGEEASRVQRLKQEAEVVQEEISRVELQLSELKARHRGLLKQAAAVENSVQAKLATYTSSLSLLESDIKTFLRSKPRERSAGSDGTKQSVWQLPPQRRTLDMAREQIKIEQHELQTQYDGMKVEKDALDQGASIWKDVAFQVTEFEKRLRAEMASLAPVMTESTRAWDDTTQDERTAGMKDLYKSLKQLVSDLDVHLQRAEEQGWKLLVAAIGAELDALRRGQDILAGVVGQIGGESELNGKQVVEAGSEPKDHDARPSAANDHQGNLATRHDTDDEPDPDLLFSLQDDDGD